MLSWSSPIYTLGFREVSRFVDEPHRANRNIQYLVRCCTAVMLRALLQHKTQLKNRLSHSKRLRGCLETSKSQVAAAVHLLRLVCSACDTYRAFEALFYPSLPFTVWNAHNDCATAPRRPTTTNDVSVEGPYPSPLDRVVPHPLGNCLCPTQPCAPIHPALSFSLCLILSHPHTRTHPEHTLIWLLLCMLLFLASSNAVSHPQHGRCLQPLHQVRRLQAACAGQDGRRPRRNR